MRCKKYLPLIVIVIATLLIPCLGFCSVETTLGNIQLALVGRILPLVATLGLVISGLSFVTGSPNARTHLILAIFGALIGFGSSQIILWIRALVN